MRPDSELTPRELTAKYGPVYDIDSAALRHYRHLARNGLKNLTEAERHAYAEAIESAVKAAQRASLHRGGYRDTPCNCVSGTPYNDGAKIHEALRQRTRREAQAASDKQRRDRTPEQWKEMYEAAMKEKREREAAQALAATNKSKPRCKRRKDSIVPKLTEGEQQTLFDKIAKQTTSFAITKEEEQIIRSRAESVPSIVPAPTLKPKLQRKRIRLVSVAIEDDDDLSPDDPGLCLACNKENHGVGPNARYATCEHCGANRVFGAEAIIKLTTIKESSDVETQAVA